LAKSGGVSINGYVDNNNNNIQGAPERID